jgi:heptosyltransferase-2
MTETGRPKNILVLRYRFIGDTILTVPFLRNLRRAEPEARIVWVVAPGSSEVVRGIPYVDELLFWDPVTIHADSRGTHRTWGDKIGFVRELRRRNFDKVYVLKRSLSSALIGFFSGARERVGFATEGRGLLLTRQVPYRHDRHEVENFLAVLTADGVPVLDDFLECWSTRDEREEVTALLQSHGVAEGEKLVALHPFAASTHRGWHLEDFAALSRLLEGEGYRPLLIGAPGDRDALAPMRGLFAPSCLDLVGAMKLRVTMALLQRVDLFVGNDSGVMHLAAAAGIPLVALFGPQSPGRFGPWSTRARVIYKQYPCSPCKQKFFKECAPSPRMKPACIEAIGVDEVFRECCLAVVHSGTQ